MWADMPSVTCQGMLPGAMELIVSLVRLAGSVDGHRVGSEARVLATGLAGEEQPGAVDSSRHLLGSSSLDVDHRELAAPADEHNQPAAAAVVWAPELGPRPPAATLDDGSCDHRPCSAFESTAGDEQPGQQPVESSAKPKPKPKPRPKSAGGPAFVPEPWVQCADAAQLTCQQECVICMDQPKSVFLAPCGHLVACLSCAEEHYGVDGCLAVERNLHCPLCRKLLTATAKAIYF